MSKRRNKKLFNFLNISVSGYYKWLKSNKYRDYEDYLLIKEIFDKSKSKKGYRRISMDLKNNKGIVVNHKKIIRIMNKYGLITKIRRKNPYRNMFKKTQEHRFFGNILNREFKENIPYKKLSTDITYVYFNNRKAYLSVIKDIATKEILSWQLSTNLSMNIVLNTINKLNKYNLTKETLIHSDQGFHYTNPEYI